MHWIQWILIISLLYYPIHATSDNNNASDTVFFTQEELDQAIKEALDDNPSIKEQATALVHMAGQGASRLYKKMVGSSSSSSSDTSKIVVPGGFPGASFSDSDSDTVIIDATDAQEGEEERVDIDQHLLDPFDMDVIHPDDFMRDTDIEHELRLLGLTDPIRYYKHKDVVDEPETTSEPVASSTTSEPVASSTLDHVLPVISSRPPSKPSRHTESPSLTLLKKGFANKLSMVEFSGLFLAITNNDIKQLKLLLEQGVDPEMQREDGLTALGKAIEEDKLVIVNQLWQKGARVPFYSTMDKEYKQPRRNALQYASEKNATLSVKFLLKQGISPNDMQQDVLPLFHAVRNENMGMVKDLLDHGAKVVHNFGPLFPDVHVNIMGFSFLLQGKGRIEDIFQYLIKHYGDLFILGYAPCVKLIPATEDPDIKMTFNIYELAVAYSRMDRLEYFITELDGEIVDVLGLQPAIESETSMLHLSLHTTSKAYMALDRYQSIQERFDNFTLVLTLVQSLVDKQFGFYDAPVMFFQAKSKYHRTFLDLARALEAPDVVLNWIWEEGNYGDLDERVKRSTLKLSVEEDIETTIESTSSVSNTEPTPESTKSPESTESASEFSSFIDLASPELPLPTPVLPPKSQYHLDHLVKDYKVILQELKEQDAVLGLLDWNKNEYMLEEVQLDTMKEEEDYFSKMTSEFTKALYVAPSLVVMQPAATSTATIPTLSTDPVKVKSKKKSKKKKTKKSNSEDIIQHYHDLELLEEEMKAVELQLVEPELQRMDDFMTMELAEWISTTLSLIKYLEHVLVDKCSVSPKLSLMEKIAERVVKGKSLPQLGAPNLMHLATVKRILVDHPEFSTWNAVSDLTRGLQERVRLALLEIKERCDIDQVSLDKMAVLPQDGLLLDPSDVALVLSTTKFLSRILEFDLGYNGASTSNRGACWTLEDKIHLFKLDDRSDRKKVWQSIKHPLHYILSVKKRLFEGLEKQSLLKLGKMHIENRALYVKHFHAIIRHLDHFINM